MNLLALLASHHADSEAAIEDLLLCSLYGALLGLLLWAAFSYGAGRPDLGRLLGAIGFAVVLLLCVL